MTAPATVALLESLAQRLDDLGVARYSPTGYTDEADVPAVFFEELPPSPEAAVALIGYDDLRTRDRWNPDFYVRLRFRAAGESHLPVHQLADAAFEVLDTTDVAAGRQQWPGGVNVLTCFRVVRAQSVPDSNGRYMRADSYRITLNPGE